MRESNDGWLIEKLKSMPEQKLCIDAKNRIIKNIRSTGAELELNASRAHRRLKIYTAAAVIIAAAVISAGTLTGSGRQLSYNLLAKIKPLGSDGSYSQNNVQNDEKAVPSPSPAAGSTIQAEADEDLVNTSSYLQYIKMLDNNSGWALNRVSVFRTSDGGTTWKDVSPKNYTGNFAGEYFLDKDHGYVAVSGKDGYSCTVYRTSDGGATWKPASGIIEACSVSFNFYDEKHGWAIAHKDIAMHHEEVDILKTTDSGSSWSIISSVSDSDKPGSLPFYGLKSGPAFSNLKSVWVSLDIPSPDTPFLYSSRDGGRTWNAAKLPLPDKYKDSGAYAYEPMFFSEKDGILPVEIYEDSQAEPYIFYATHDGGSTWSAGSIVYPSPQSRLYWDFKDCSNGFAFDGVKMYVTGDGGETWTGISCTTPLKDISQISFMDENTGTAISDGILFQTDDGGRTWHKKQNDLPYLPYAEMSGDAKNEDAARALFAKYLDYFKDKDVLQSQKITGYRIDNIKVSSSSEAGFTFDAAFSVQCTEDSARWTGGAALSSDGWTGQKNLTVTVSRTGTYYTVTSIK